MKEEGDYLLACTSFAAGIVFAKLSGSCPQAFMAAVSSALLLASTICLASIVAGKPCRLKYILLFSLLGAFCCTNEHICVIGPVHESGITASERIHAWFCGTLDSIEFEDARTAPLLKAMMCGDKSDLGRDVKNIFRTSGAAHLLALSGLHLGIIYSLVSRISAPLGRSRPARMAGAAAAITICGFYTIMTGKSPSTVRALIFICANEFSKLADGRRKRPLRLLMTAFIIQLAITPHVLDTVGFQLSYLATLGICTLMPVLSSWYPRQAVRNDPMRKIWDGMALAISCQVFTAPLSWLYFHSFPKYFLLSNIIAIPIATVLISLTAAILAATSVGACPEILVKAVDICSGMLLESLETISAM